MANRIVAIEMDKVRNIKFGINGLIRLEKALGRPLTSLGEQAFSIADLRTMLFIGLSWEDKSLTEDVVGDLMDDCMETQGIAFISEKLSEALTGSMGGHAMPSDK